MMMERWTVATLVHYQSRWPNSWPSTPTTSRWLSRARVVVPQAGLRAELLLLLALVLLTARP